jgi:organic radical activating enzyme
MNFDTELYVTQMIPTIQGEGDFTGFPSLLIRLLGCNLKCDFCDSKFTWNSKNTKEIYLESNLDKLKNDIIVACNGYRIDNLMITGGEPTLYRNNPLFNYLILNSSFSTIEIETNGTDLMNFPKSPDVYLNISPKLDIKYYKDEEDYNKLIENIKFIRSDNYYHTLKFVDDDREQFFNFLEICEIPKEEYVTIRIMPKTKLRSECDSKMEFLIELQKSSLNTLKFCMEYGFQFTPRNHLYLFNDCDEKF